MGATVQSAILACVHCVTRNAHCVDRHSLLMLLFQITGRAPVRQPLQMAHHQHHLRQGAVVGIRQAMKVTRGMVVAKMEVVPIKGVAALSSLARELAMTISAVASRAALCTS